MEGCMATKTKVMFLCSHNSCRSQMGEALLRNIAGDKFDVYSSGLYPQEIHPMTLRVLEELNIPTNNLKSKNSRDMLSEHVFKYVIIVCADADKECPHVWPNVGERLFWPFEDPGAYKGTDEEKLANFREVRNLIKNKLESWVNSIL